MRRVLLGIVCLVITSACQKASDLEVGSKNTALKNSATALRVLTPSERASDFEQLAILINTYYGPYQYKERLLGISIADTLASLKANAILAKSDEEFAGYVMQMGAALRDGHVQIGIQNTTSGIAGYQIPIFVTPIEGKTIVAYSDKAFSQKYEIKRGDEILEVDGVTPDEYLKTILKYKRSSRTAVDQHNIFLMLKRPSYITELKPVSATVVVKTRKPDGSEKTQEIPWTMVPYSAVSADMNLQPGAINFSAPMTSEILQFSRHQMGDVRPFFLTETVTDQYSVVQVYPSEKALREMGLGKDEKPSIYAGLYRYQGKTVLLVRQATYSPKDFNGKQYVSAYRALLKEFESLVDVLIVDQTHNPGGSYCGSFYDLFSKSGDLQMVQSCHADRAWINSFKIDKAESLKNLSPWLAKDILIWSQKIEDAYDRGDWLAEPIPLFTGEYQSNPKEYTWKKPMLVLIDELAGSCGDIFPMLIKANRRAVLFGQTTMGLGGNVDEVGVLANSQIKIRLTRGLFSTYSPQGIYSDDSYIENKGVTPDVEYTHTLKDFRAGYVGYFQRFTEEALKQIQP